MTELTRTQMLDTLLKSYTTWYDVVQPEDNDGFPAATAAFHEHGEKYVLSHKAKLWSADHHEYVCFYSVDELSAELFQRAADNAWEYGLSIVEPEKDHMSSDIVALIICTSISDGARDAVKKLRRSKSFMLSIQGWMELQIIVVSESGEFIANPAGKHGIDGVRNVLFPPVKKSRVKAFFTRRL